MDLASELYYEALSYTWKNPYLGQQGNLTNNAGQDAFRAWEKMSYRSVRWINLETGYLLVGEIYSELCAI